VSHGKGEQGILATRTAAYGYFKTGKDRPDVHPARRRVLRPDGDWATVDEDGSINLLGRGSMSINSGGEKIFAEEVEEAVKRHPLIDDCLVVGIPDERFGQRVVAIVATVAPSHRSPKRSTSSFDCRWRTTRSPERWSCEKRPARAERKADYKWAHEVALEEHVGR